MSQKWFLRNLYWLPSQDIEPNRVQLPSEIPKVSPEIIKGLQVTHSTPIAERVSRTNTWKLCGQGNPMMGMPSNSLEVKYFLAIFSVMVHNLWNSSYRHKFNGKVEPWQIRDPNGKLFLVQSARQNWLKELIIIFNQKYPILHDSYKNVYVTFYDILKGKFKLASQIVKVGDNGMHVFVNDWDINNWNMFMYVGNWQPKLRGHHFKGKIYFVQGSTR